MKLGNATIQEGSIVADVKEAQRILTGQGYNVGPIDGIFGPQTKTAVLSFQKAKGLLPDGIIGPQTWAALRGQAPPVVPMTPKLPGAAPGSSSVVALSVVGAGGSRRSCHHALIQTVIR